MMIPESSARSKTVIRFRLTSSLMVLALVISIVGCVGRVSPPKTSPTQSSALRITTAFLPAATVGANYSATLTAVGGVAPYSWRITDGSLPSGLQLSGLTGTISGASDLPGNFSIKAEVLDANFSSADVGLTLSAAPSAAPTISTVSPSSGPHIGGTTITILGNNFRSGAVVQFGSLLAASVQVVDSTQIRAVTPAESIGTVNVAVQDYGGQSVTAANAFAFVAPLQIATTELPAGTVGGTYSTTLSATGGVPPYSWSTAGGALPRGLQLSAPTGTIAGTPAVAGTLLFTAQVQDAKASQVSTGLSFRISTAATTTAVSSPVVAITDPSNGATISKSANVSASLTGSQGSVASVQLYLNGSQLGPPLTSGPYIFTWDTTQVADGIYSLSAIATTAGSVTTSAGINVIVKNTSWNPSVLGVPWASDFITIAANEIDVKMDPRLKVKAAGDGVTDDTVAIRGAIQLASSSGGGTVYFPTGDYKIVTPSGSTSGSPLVVPSRVILRGATSTTSRIFVNDPQATSETDGTWTWGGIDFQGSSLSGMTDLGVYAANSSNSLCALLWNRGSTQASELFFNNLDVHLDNSKSFWLEATDNLLIQNSSFESNTTQLNINASQYGPIYIAGNSNVSFVKNLISYHFGRVHMPSNTNLLMQGNTLMRDAQNKDMDDGTAAESGGVELSFSQNIQVLNNTIQTLNAPADEAGDGEAIMSQQSTVQDVLDAGNSTAITSTTLTDSNALWGPVTVSRLAQFPEVVVILTGSGTGEWRTIQGVNTSTKTLTFGQPWNPVPEVGSLYSIFAWTLMNATIQGNTLIDNPNGIVIYDGCYSCSVQNNVLTNSRQIILRATDELLNQSVYPEGRRVHEVVLESSILDNTVSNTSGIRPAYIALDTEAFATDSYRGMGMLNVQIGGNTLNPYSPNPSQNYPNPKQTEITQEGFFPCFLFGPATAKAPVTVVFQSVNFWNNSQSLPVTYSSSFSPHTSVACVTPAAP